MNLLCNGLIISLVLIIHTGSYAGDANICKSPETSRLVEALIQTHSVLVIPIHHHRFSTLLISFNYKPTFELEYFSTPFSMYNKILSCPPNFFDQPLVIINGSLKSTLSNHITITKGITQNVANISWSMYVILF